MGLSPGQTRQTAHHFVNMVSVCTLPQDKTNSTNSSPYRGFTPWGRRLRLRSAALPPPGFSRFPVFPPRRGDLVFNISNDEPVVDGETGEQRQQREQRNADRAQLRADEKQQLIPNNLDDAFDMVGNQQLFKTPSANVDVAMANLDRLPDTPEYQDVWSNDPTYGHIWSPRWDKLLLCSKGSKPSPIRRSPPTRLIAAEPHRDPADIVVVVCPSTIAGRTPIATTVVGTLAITTNKDMDVVTSWTKTRTYDKTYLIGMPASASTGALLIEQYTKTCDTSSTMQPMAPLA